jgi:hypothetical protein
MEPPLYFPDSLPPQSFHGSKASTIGRKVILPWLQALQDGIAEFADIALLYLHVLVSSRLALIVLDWNTCTLFLPPG